MAYRPKVNEDWDEYAEPLAVRSTREAALRLGSTRRRECKPRQWGYNIQRHNPQAREQVNEALREAFEERADRHNKGVRPHDIKAGDGVRLYLDHAKEVYARKLAHIRHESFGVAGID
ncbi:hypothetical protein PC128_g24574 [Phytophthora cactorum]|nr:hypothetical protein PC128_g24574 [Phytophthora cactorum]